MPRLSNPFRARRPNLYPTTTEVIVHNRDAFRDVERITFRVDDSSFSPSGSPTAWLTIRTHRLSGQSQTNEFKIDTSDMLDLARMLHGMAAYQINREQQR